MKIDNIDLDILTVFINADSLTSTDVTKIFYEEVVNDRALMIAKNSFISHRLKKWLERDVLCCEVIDNKSHYTINFNRVTIGESHLTVNGKSVDMGKALVIDMDNNRFLIEFIDDC